MALSAKPRRGQVLFVNADAEFHAGRAQNYLRPEHIEKIVSTFDRFEDVPGYARRVALAEIGGSANDWNLNIRRYVDNSPPPESHDVRAHLLGGVPVAEVAAKRALFEALGYAVHAFVLPSPSGRDAGSEGAYFDFAPALTDRAAIRLRVENDPGVRARIEALRAALAAWWIAHAPRLADLPEHRQLNRVRAEFLDTFGAVLLPLGTLDRFQLAGVIATWWTDTLPDFKTLLEDGYLDLADVKTVRVFSNELERFRLKCGDVLMNEGGDYDKLGRGTVWENQIPVCLHQNHVFRVRCRSEVLNCYFLAAVSGSEIGKRYFLRSSKQSTNLASINSTQLNAFEVPVPNLAEQETIIRILKVQDNQLTGEVTGLTKLRALKSALMTDLLTGRVRVPADLDLG